MQKVYIQKGEKKVILLIRPSINEKMSFGLPLGILYISSVLKQNGFNTKIVDYVVDGDTDIEKIINEYNPEIVGVSVTFNIQMENAMKIAKQIKNMGRKILLTCGGNPVTVTPEYFLGVFDVAVRGEGEFTMLELAQGKDLEDIDGISYQKDGKIFHNQQRELIPNLDVIPFPDYDSIDLKKYFNPFLRLNYFGDVSSKSISMITSRGCPFNCFFCAVKLQMGRTWRAHSVEYMLRHLEFVTKKYGVEHLSFEDDNMTLNRKRFEGMLDGMIANKIDVTWATPNGVRLDTLDKGLLRKMKESGLVKLTIAIESGSQEFLDNVIHKNIKLTDAIEIARICKEEKILVAAFYMIGLPGETKKDIEKTLDLAYELLIKYGVLPNVSIGTTLPGTEMTQICERNNYIRNGRVETEEFTIEDIDRYYSSFVKKLVVPYLLNINWLSVIKNVNHFPHMVKKFFNPKKTVKM